MVGRIRIGDFDTLCYPIPDDVAAVCSCIQYTKGETIREGKPFLGLNIGDDDPIAVWQFEDAIKFIGKYLGEGDVQVICQEGRSRSVAIGLAYYLSAGMSYERAIIELGDRYPACRIHAWSLTNWAHHNGFIDKETFESEISRINS